MRLVALLVVLLLGAGCGGTTMPGPVPSPLSSPATTSPGATLSPTPRPAPRRAPPLAGVVVALDPGHQLGNHNFPVQAGRPVDAGGFMKPCNSTGTAAADGWAEATFAFELALLVRARLERLGARVELTRRRDSEELWGPCVDVRGRFAARVGADVMVSLHADGAPVTESGFHVIAAPGRPRALRLARTLRAALVRAGIPRSSYVAQGLAIRADLGTLNTATVPTVMLEAGNMLNPADITRMRTPVGRSSYAGAIVAGVRAYLHR